MKGWRACISSWRWISFRVECFHHYIFNVWSHLWAERSQPCQDKNAPCVCVSVCASDCVFMPCVCAHRARVHSSYVIFEGETVLFQQPIGPSPINHTYHLSACACFCVCFWIQSQHLLLITINEQQWRECGDVLISLHIRTHACAPMNTHMHTDKGQVKRTRTKRRWLICQWRLGSHKEEKDRGNRIATEEERARKTEADRYQQKQDDFWSSWCCFGQVCLCFHGSITESPLSFFLNLFSHLPRHLLVIVRY